MSCTCVIHAVMREEPPGDQCPVHPIRWVSVKSLADELAAAREAGRLAALYEAEQIIRAHARDCGCWERMLADVDRERDGTSVFSSGAGAAGDQGPAKKPADTGPAPETLTEALNAGVPLVLKARNAIADAIREKMEQEILGTEEPANADPAPDIAADREALGQILELGTLSPGQWVELKKLCRDMVAAAREHGRLEGRAAALAIAAADIRLLASEGWVPAAGEAPKAGSQLLEMAARRIESIARGENLCSICRRYHGKEITHACE